MQQDPYQPLLGVRLDECCVDKLARGLLLLHQPGLRVRATIWSYAEGAAAPPRRRAILEELLHADGLAVELIAEERAHLLGIDCVVEHEQHVVCLAVALDRELDVRALLTDDLFGVPVTHLIRGREQPGGCICGEEEKGSRKARRCRGRASSFAHLVRDIELRHKLVGRVRLDHNVIHEDDGA